jgi:class 3 adenylate cyclase
VRRATGNSIEAARDALDRHAWDEAYEILKAADRDGSLKGEELELLAGAAYWSGHPDETVELLERSYSAYLEEGNRREAAMAAFRVGEQHGMRMALAQAQGWAAKAARLAEDDSEWPVHGWLVWVRGLMAWFQGDFEAALAAYDESLALADRTGDRDLHAMSLHDKGHALCLVGRAQEGVAALDEAMTSVVGGELSPHAAGYVYCGMIGACSKLGEFRRAAEWTEATLRWCERDSVPAFPGVCRIHKAELLRLRGSLASAEREARLACEELPRFSFFSGLGPANYEIAEVRRRLGDLDEAEAAYARAHEYGYNPQPGLSLLRLAQGRPDAAAVGIRQVMEESRGNHSLQVRLLAAQVEIALAQDDIETAASASRQLDAVVSEYRSDCLRAIAAGARGAVLVARGEPERALPELRRAQEAWRVINAPHEVAELRLLVARAHQVLGDRDAAQMEARAARDVLERLGARPAAERAAALLGELAPPDQPAERVGRTFMFTDIVRSTDLVGAIGDDAWENLLRWHDRTLRSLFASHGGEVGHHTGDGFFVAFEEPASAVRSAVAVQRALDEHRREHGFALQVRIGIHAGDATRRGQDYSGGEVHKAARIASLAEGSEILASEETATSVAGEARISDLRSVALKGFPDPVTVATVGWR